MMPVLDIRTISFLTLVLCFLFGIGMILFAYGSHSFRVIRLIGWGFVLQGMSFLLLALRNQVPDFVSIVLANTLIFVSTQLVYGGLLRFRQKKSQMLRIGPLATVILLALFVYYTYYSNDTSVRILLISLFVAPIYFLCAYVLLVDMPDTIEIPYLISGLPMILYGLFLIFRAIWTMVEGQLTSFMQAGTIHALAFVSVQFSVISTCFGVVWIGSSLL